MSPRNEYVIIYIGVTVHLFRFLEVIEAASILKVTEAVVYLDFVFNLQKKESDVWLSVMLHDAFKTKAIWTVYSSSWSRLYVL